MFFRNAVIPTRLFWESRFSALFKEKKNPTSRFEPRHATLLDVGDFLGQSGLFGDDFVFLGGRKPPRSPEKNIGAHHSPIQSRVRCAHSKSISGKMYFWHTFDFKFQQLASSDTLLYSPASKKYSNLRGAPMKEALFYYGGIVAIVSSIGLLTSAMRVRQGWTRPMSETEEFVTSGPYRYIRHPGYVSYFMFHAGVAFMFESWLMFLPLLHMMVFLGEIASKEEDMFKKRYGDEYAAYERRSWRYVPFVY